MEYYLCDRDTIDTCILYRFMAQYILYPLSPSLPGFLMHTCSWTTSTAFEAGLKLKRHDIDPRTGCVPDACLS